MKKNKKIAPSLYSKIRNYKKQSGGYDTYLGQRRRGRNDGRGGFLSKDWVGRTLTGDQSFDHKTEYIDTPFGDIYKDSNTGGGDMSGDIAGDLSGEGGGGSAAGMIGSIASSVVDDGSDMFYTGAEVATDLGRLAAGDLTAVVDIVGDTLKRGKARRQDRAKTTIIGDEITAANREATKQELEQIGNTSADMGSTIDTGEGNYAVRVKEGGMKYYQGGDFKYPFSRGGDGAGRIGRNSSKAYTGQSGYLGSTFENVEVTKDEYDALRNPGYNVGLYGGTKLHTKGTWKDNPHNTDNQNETTYMRGTKEFILPREQRLGINPLDQRGAIFADPIRDNIKYRSEEQATRLNDKLVIREQNKRRQFQRKLEDATEIGMQDKFLKRYAKDVRRFKKRGNTESGFRNLLRKIISPIIPKWGLEYANKDAKFESGRGYKQGGMKLEGGSMMSIPGSDAVEFKGRRHSQGGIIDGDSEVEGGETKDGVSSAKHGGMQMPYYFSDYINTDGSKKYGGYSFADAHKKLLKEGGSQAEIDALAAAQDKVAGRKSKVAGYAQKGDFKYLSSEDKFRLMQDMVAPVDMEKRPIESFFPENIENTENLSEENLMPPSFSQDKTYVAPLPPMRSQTDLLRDFMNRDRSKPVTEKQLESVLGPRFEKQKFAKNFKQGGMKHQTGSFKGMSYADRRNFLLDNYGFDVGRNYDFGSKSDYGEQAFIDNYGDTIGNEIVLKPDMELENTDNTNSVDTVTTSGNTTTNTITGNPYAKADKLALAASMLAPMAAYTAKVPQMPAVGDVSAVETPQLKYQKFDRERAINENDFQKMVNFIKTRGGGPADMINLMAVYDKKMEANAGVTDREMKHRVEIDNLQANLDLKSDTINVGNELQLKNLKQNAQKINVMLQSDQQSNRVNALQTVAANLVTANRDRKAYDAGILLANAIDGGSGVLGRALSPEELQEQVDNYLKGEGYLKNSDSKKKEPTVVTDGTHDHDHEELSAVSDSTSFDPNLNVVFRGGKEGDPHFGSLAAVGMFNLQDAIMQEDYADEGFTVTSAMRGIDHSMHREGSKHSEGNAVDFGVRNKDGKAMLKFFFDDWDGDAVTLSEKGKEFLRANNAELIDERTRKGQEHFHLEFNKVDGKERKFYAPGARTKNGNFLIYGMQQ